MAALPQLRHIEGRRTEANSSCRLCDCTRSGYSDIPNGRDDQCQNERCVCHV